MTKRYELSELIRSDNFIDGKWVASAKGKRFDVTNPATGEVIAQIADSDAADARAATDAAARAFPHGATPCRKIAPPCYTAGMR